MPPVISTFTVACLGSSAMTVNLMLLLGSVNVPPATMPSSTAVAGFMSSNQVLKPRWVRWRMSPETRICTTGVSPLSKPTGVRYSR